MSEATRPSCFVHERTGRFLLSPFVEETSCAISAAAQLSVFTDYADLDGPLLIKNNLFDGITFTNGKITLSDKPGIGVIKKSAKE